MSRELLHKKDLEAFKEWCNKYGVPTREGRGDYQVLQVQRFNIWYPIYERDDTHAGNELVHLTVADQLLPVVKSFIRDKKVTGETDPQGTD